MTASFIIGVTGVLVFAGAALAAGSVKWQCRECGKVLSTSAIHTPSPTGYGKCPCTATGAHIWRKIS